MRVVGGKRATGARREPHRDAGRHESAGARDLGLARGDDRADTDADPL